MQHALELIRGDTSVTDNSHKLTTFDRQPCVPNDNRNKTSIERQYIDNRGINAILGYVIVFHIRDLHNKKKSLS